MHPVSRSVVRRAAAVVAVILVAGGIAAPAAPVAAAGCKVTNTTTKVSKPTLQAAVDAAAPKQTLQVRGTCTGSTTIDTFLTIVGVPSKTLGKPALVGSGGARVLLIVPNITVTIAGLTVRGGDVSLVGSFPENTGGGIRNEGRLTLRNVLVKGNKALYGGGIVTTGPLTLAGTTRLTGNTADSAGGLFVDGTAVEVTAVLRDKARIDHNSVAQEGGGIGGQFGRIVLAGASQVDHNTGDNGAGVSITAVKLVMSGTSRIHHNTGIGEGAGVSATGGRITMTGSSRVTANTTTGQGGGLSMTTGNVVMKGRAQVDRNQATGTGGVRILKGELTMSGASSVHHNRAVDNAGVLLASNSSFENRLTMRDTSSIHHNVATAAGANMAASIDGDLVMNDRSVIRDHHSDVASRAVEVYLLVPGGTPSVTLTGKSRIRDNHLAAGFAALAVWPDCGSPVTRTGLGGRVVNNTPGNVMVVVGC